MKVEPLCCDLTEIKLETGQVFDSDGNCLFEFNISSDNSGDYFYYNNKRYSINGRIDGESFIIYLGLDSNNLIAVHINGLSNEVNYHNIDDGRIGDYLDKLIT